MSDNKTVTTSLGSVLRENAVLIVMYALGTVLTAILWWPLGLIYLGYALLSNVLYMAWVCAYCGNYTNASCPAGYHWLSGGRFHAKDGRKFADQFRRNVVVLYPGWFFPPIVGVVALVRDFSWVSAGILVMFLLVAFVLLPQDSGRHCGGCEEGDCPRENQQAE